MHIHIQDRDPIGVATHILGCDGDIVEVTESARLIAKGMMAWRAAQGIGRTLARQDQVGRRQSHLGRRLGRTPGTGPMGQAVSAM